jgi:protease YdgD
VFAKNQSFIPAETVHVVLGYARQQFSEHLHVKAYLVAKGFMPSHPYETLASDWALLALDTDAKSRPLITGSSSNVNLNAPVMTGGYSHATPYSMSADSECRFLARSKDQHFMFDTCRAPAGFSGSPVLVKDGQDQYKVVGIHVANQNWQTNSIAVALPLENILPEIAPCMKKQDCKFQVVAQGREPTAAEVLSGLPNLGYRSSANASAGQK